jgi:D-alanine---D-serine ligase
MKRLKIAILFGGCSTEYPVSLQSAYSVISNLDLKYYEPILIGITREGDWKKYSGPPEAIMQDKWNQSQYCVPAFLTPSRSIHGLVSFQKGLSTTEKIDVAFPVLHGKNGEDGTLQGLLSMAGIPCVGCGVLSSALCMDKDAAHRLVQLAGIPVPRSVALTKKLPKAKLLKAVADLHFPLFVKPIKSGSSFGITKVDKPDMLFGAVDTAFQFDSKVLIEEEVEGFEVGCAVLGNDTLTVGEVDEIELSHGFFDYTEKYTLKTSKIHTPARIDADTASRIKETAQIIYRTLDCSGFARVDMFLTPDRKIVFNEVNTIPGFTSHSRYPSMMKGIGMDFKQIIDQLIRLAMENENDQFAPTGYRKRKSDSGQPRSPDALRAKRKRSQIRTAGLF